MTPVAHLDRTTNTAPLDSTTSLPRSSSERTARRHCGTDMPTCSASSRTVQSRRSRLTARCNFNCVLPMPRDIPTTFHEGTLRNPRPRRNPSTNTVG